MKSRGVTFLIVTLLGAFCSVTAQDFMLQGWYWNFPKTAEGKVWADSLKDKAAELHTAGFTHVWVPPFTRTSSGSWSNGYDPKDLFDLGEFGQGATHFGTRTDVNEMITAFNNQSITTIADVVFNHRDGGKPERNTAVRGWIDNYNSAKVNNGDLPYPSDRFRYILPIGASTGRGAGNYYFKISSASGHSNFHNYQYRLYMWTNRVGWQNLADTNEVEPNGGGNCSQGNNTITLGRGWLANVDSDGCTVDEFHLSLASTDFNSAGDTIYIELRNTGGYSDHRIFGLWDGANSQEIVSQLELQTYTDFTSLPSGRGGMNYLNFKPNGNATCLCGDEDFMYFYYDYDQYQNATKDTLYAWAKWLWQDVGIRGYRMDAVKHFPTWFVGDLMDYLHDNSIDPGIVVGEHYTSDATTLNNWVNSVLGSMDNDTKAAIDVRIFDFSLRQALENASDSYGYDVRNVFGASLVDAKGTSPFNVITFANNHDFRDAGQPIDNDPILAYAYLLTNNQLGVPCVYYPDYYSLGIKAKIDTLMSIHKNYIYGATSREYLGRNGTTRYQSFLGGYANTSLVYQLMNTNSGHDVIVAINYAGGTDTLRLYQELNMTNLAQGDSLRDKTGNYEDNYENKNQARADATAYQADKGNEYKVIFSGGEPTRCLEYCNVAQFCKQFNQTAVITDNTDTQEFLESLPNGKVIEEIKIISMDKQTDPIETKQPLTPVSGAENDSIVESNIIVNPIEKKPVEELRNDSPKKFDVNALLAGIKKNPKPELEPLKENMLAKAADEHKKMYDDKVAADKALEDIKTEDPKVDTTALNDFDEFFSNAKSVDVTKDDSEIGDLLEGMGI